MDTKERAEFIEEHGEAGEAYLAYNGEHSTVEGFEDSYQGAYESDKDFAQEMAESIGAIDTEASTSWPAYCIDWEYAARELMHDYYEENGHYFRA